MTKATIKGRILSVDFNGDPSCSPGPIVIRAGVYDFTRFLACLDTPLDPEAAWPDSLPWLEPGFPGLLFADTLTLQGADIKTTPSGTPYTFDITTLAEWCRLHNTARKPLGLVFLTIGGEGKINLYSDESFTTHDTARLMGVSLEQDGCETLFQYDPRSWKSLTGRIQYTGHTRQNIRYKNAMFVLGGHHKRLPDGTYIDKDRCGFFFHRGLARHWGWNDTYYDTIPPALRSISVRELSPSSASILIIADKETRSLLSFGTGALNQALEQSGHSLSHLFVLSGLSDTTPYNFQAFLTDSAGNTLMTPKDSFKTLAKRPKISGVVISGTTAASAELNWKTATPARCKILYGLQDHINTFMEIPALDTLHGSRLLHLLPNRRYEFIIIARDERGLSDTSAVFTFTTPDVIAADTGKGSPERAFRLSQNNPNPFNTATSLTYQLPEGAKGSEARLIIRNLLGQIIHQTRIGTHPGSHTFTWRPSGMNPGVYIVEILSGNRVLGKRKMIRL